MSQDRSLIFWTGLLAVTFVATGRPLPADAPSPASSDGYKIVPVTVGGRTVPIRVKEEGDPYKNVSSSNSDGKYDPERIFSTESSMANKKFALPSNSASTSASGLKNRDQDTFITKAYDTTTSSSAPSLHTKAGFPTTSAYSRSDTEFDKNYPTSPIEDGKPRTVALASATSTDQNRTAVLEHQTIRTSDALFAEKTFHGPEADAAHRHLTKTDDGRIFISDLPNRALTIDEVRNLINHGFKPDTEAKPPPPSKPLNDPDYKPEPLRDTPSPASEDDKNDPVPPPGTMAVPENSEPLPQP